MKIRYEIEVVFREPETPFAPGVLNDLYTLIGRGIKDALMKMKPVLRVSVSWREVTK